MFVAHDVHARTLACKTVASPRPHGLLHIDSVVFSFEFDAVVTLMAVHGKHNEV